MTSSELREMALSLLAAADVLHVAADAAGPLRAEVSVHERGVRHAATMLLEEARTAEVGAGK